MTDTWGKPFREKYKELLPLFSRALEKAEKLSKDESLKKLFPDNTPRVISRIKSVDSTVEKIKRKIPTGDQFETWITKQEFEKILFDERGIGDFIGIRLIFPRVEDYGSVHDTFVTNYLVRDHKFKVTHGRDIKNRTSGYTSVHSHVLVPFKQKGKNYEIPLELQLNSEMMNVWMEKQHELIYKAQEINLKTEQYLPELYSILADLTGLLEKMIFLPDKYRK